jgi:lipopolysaccharide/colanic/teichoic acid biosynthesis glycosyltransferase
MGTEYLGHQNVEFIDEAFIRTNAARGAADTQRWQPARRTAIRELTTPPESHTYFKEPSAWSKSGAKRVFDCVCVLLVLPVLAPAFLLIAAAVRITSRGPVLFLQKRVGRDGRTFTILKFRTMINVADGLHHAVTTLDNQRFTPVGPFLRRWKLDELPQLVNVLLGQMSLVGPRPKMMEHEIFRIPCRPGITGMATLAFAEEETILARVHKDQLNRHYHNVVLPAKREIDAEYMARATFGSDFRLLVNSVLRRWDPATAEIFVAAATIEAEAGSESITAHGLQNDSAQMPATAPESGWMALS